MLDRKSKEVIGIGNEYCSTAKRRWRTEEHDFFRPLLLLLREPPL